MLPLRFIKIRSRYVIYTKNWNGCGCMRIEKWTLIPVHILVMEKSEKSESVKTRHLET